MDGSTSFDGFRIPDVLWNKIAQILPKYPSGSKGGKPRQNLRSIMDAIFYRSRTGCQWKAIPNCFAPGSTAHQYFQEWVELGVECPNFLYQSLLKFWLGKGSRPARDAR